MNNKTIRFSKQRGRIHPLMATAAVAVTLVSLVGIAAITGVIPTSHGSPAPAVAMNQAPLMATPNEPVANNAVVTPAPSYMAAPAPNYAAAPVPTYAPSSSTAYEAPPVIRHAAPHHVTTKPNYADQYPREVTQVAQGPAVCGNCGRVESVVAIHEAVKPSGLGIAAGAVLGGVLGNQVGGGNGRTLATVAGAVAGGYGGNEVEKRTRSTTSYQVRVRMEDGHVRTFPQSGQDGWRVGDRVRVVNGALTSRG
jgi:outer membrane lipoprotein SlyB